MQAPQQGSVTDAHALSCAHCGARVSITSDQSHARCTYCGTDTPVPEPLRDAVRNAAARRALDEVKLTAMRGATEAADTSGARMAKAYGGQALMIGGVLVFSAVMSARAGAFSLRSYAGPAGTLLTVVSGAVAALVLQRGRRRVWLRELKVAAPAGHSARCPECGSDLPTQTGEPTVRCGHCHVTSLLPASVVDAGVRARQEQILAEREVAMASSVDAGRRAQVVSFVMFGLMFATMIAGWVFAYS